MHWANVLTTRISIGCVAAALIISAEARAVTFSEQGATILRDSSGNIVPGGVNYAGRSVSLADIDNDGDLDAFFQGSTSTVRQIFINNIIGTGEFTFSNKTATWLPSPSGLNASWSSAWGDYNGDGRIDVFVGQDNPSGSSGDVLRNDGSAFSNQTTSTGLTAPSFHQNVAWADINNDGRLDLLIGMEGPVKHAIYVQDTPGHFTNVAVSAGFQQSVGTRSYGMAIGDSDGDGDLDVYISTCDGTDSIRNNFYKNMLIESGNNTLTFVDIAGSSAADPLGNGTQNTRDTYGTEFVDFDNDGDLDLYVTGAGNSSQLPGQQTPTKIYRNDGSNMFTDIDTVTGHALLSDTGRDLNGSKAVDYDNDGDLDLYFHDNLATSGVNHKLYRNNGNWEFEDVTIAALLNVAADGSDAGTDPDVVGAGAYDSTWGDLDLDGDQDLIHPNNSTYNSTIPTPERVYISDASTNGNHWLYIDLKGPASNTSAVGASVFATISDGAQDITLRREANTNAGTFNQSDVPVHFGLGSASVIEELRIQWPDGSKQSLFDVAVDQYLSVQYLPGDYSGDGVVNTADYVLWRNGLGATYHSYKPSDYYVWRSHFGQSLPGSGSGAAVPEPASAGLLIVAMAALMLVTPLSKFPRKSSE